MKRVLFVLGLSLGLLALIGVASADLPPGGSFTDDNGNVHEANIEAIAAAGITKGCNPPANDRYCPDESVTRAQMAAFLVRALDLTDDGGGNSFVDDDGSVFESDIAKLAAAGITRGCNPPVNNMFCPGSSVTRAQMAAFLVRALDLTDDGGGNSFVDDDGSIFEADIAKLAAAGITKGCNPPANDRYCPNDPVRRDQMASFLARALKLDPIVPPEPAGAMFAGSVEPTPGFTGEISFEVANNNTKVMNLALEMVLDNYDCGGGLTVSGSGIKRTYDIVLPVVNGSFSYSSGVLTWSGTFDSPTRATGTISGSELMGPSCPGGPLSWSAISTGAPPPTSSTTTTSTTTTTPGPTIPPPPPPSGWPPCDFAPFSISGSGPGVEALQVPGDKPAILDLTFSGTGTFWVDGLDINSHYTTDVVFDYTGGAYEGTRPINHNWIDGYVRYLDFIEADGSWTVDVKPICSARTMVGDSVSDAGDEVLLINRSGTATITYTGSSNFSVWSHQAFDEMDLEVNAIGAFDDTVDIDPGTVFLDISAVDTDGDWSVTFP